MANAVLSPEESRRTSIFPIFDIIDVFVFAPRMSTYRSTTGLSGTKF
jgi:hypothetical protein